MRMMDLIKINLLPYREELNQKKKQKFNVLMAASGIIGIGLAVVAFLGINQVGMPSWKVKLKYWIQQ